MAYLENGWYCAALSDEVTDNFLSRTLLDRPVLISRDAEGVAHAIGDTCPHRFSPLHTGKRIDDTVECPYHGLRFDLATGACAHNPHGSGRIASANRVPSYPVVEQAGVIWFWPGDPALADTSLLPAIRLFPGSKLIQNHVVIPVDYRLALDNQLDGSHAPYVHGTLNNNRKEQVFEHGDRWVRELRTTRNTAPPYFIRFMYDGAEGDFSADVTWTAPAALVNTLSMTAAGRPAEEGGQLQTSSLFTPETETSTHFFSLINRNRALDDAEIDASMGKVINSFLTEDMPVLSGVQKAMAGRDFFALQPVQLETDHTIRYRRILEDLIAAQSKPQLAGAA